MKLRCWEHNEKSMERSVRLADSITSEVFSVLCDVVLWSTCESVSKFNLTHICIQWHLLWIGSGSTVLTASLAIGWMLYLPFCWLIEDVCGLCPVGHFIVETSPHHNLFFGLCKLIKNIKNWFASTTKLSCWNLRQHTWHQYVNKARSWRVETSYSSSTIKLQSKLNYTTTNHSWSHEQYIQYWFLYLKAMYSVLFKQIRLIIISILNIHNIPISCHIIIIITNL